jgi:hypothetical protein
LHIRHAAGNPLWTKDFVLACVRPKAYQRHALRADLKPGRTRTVACATQGRNRTRLEARDCRNFEANAAFFNALVTVPMQRLRRGQFWMTTVKAAFLSFAMLAAIVLSGLGIYAADAANNHNAVDGYGVTAAAR